MKKSTIFLTIAAAILVVLIGKAFIFNDAVKFYLLIFVAVGLDLALLRLGVNGAIKKCGVSISASKFYFSLYY